MDKKLLEKAMEMPQNERAAFAELIPEGIDYGVEEV